LAGWRRAGIGRVSVGAESFDDGELVATGRLHRSEDIGLAVRALRAEGFSNVNLDLILGLPGQTSASWRAGLDELLRLEPEHVSIYMLDLDPKVPLYHTLALGLCALPADDLVADLYVETAERLGAAGYEQYEISNFARPGFESRHNLKYWRREP